MNTEISRDPSDYRPRDHALQRAKYRGIELDLVAETIAEGRVYSSHKPHCRVFKQAYAHTDQPVRVVADIDAQEVLTVAWEYTD